MYSTQGEFRCCDAGDTQCLYDIPVAAATGKTAAPRPAPSVVEKFTKNAPTMFEKFENSSAAAGEPVGLSSSFISQFQDVAK